MGNINNVVQRILDELKRQEKKQGDLTTYLDVPKSTFSKWKIGQSQSYKRHIDRIATFLNVSVDYLLGTETEKAPPLSNDDAELLELYSKLTEDDKKFIIKSIKNLNK
ncbi:MAG: bacteriophage CI repressor [Clostridiales bacterium]|nr:bacteriophage CI repressor [Clostridiales bacterium]